MNAPIILLVEDCEITRRLIAQVIDRAGFQCHEVPNGQAALDYCRQHKPDLILMDVEMPGLDGLDTTRQLRERFGDHWVPIIFLTSHTENEHQLNGLIAGGDDYLGKPVNYDLLTAKIAVFLRIADMQRQIALDAVRLAKYYEANEIEQALALELIQRLSQRSLIQLPHIWHHLSPAENFNGDLICRSESPSGIEHFMLADCTGHGLTAAISALPAIDSFHDLVKQYLSTSLLAAGINKKLNYLLPTGRFVAAALISIDHATGLLSIWNGGIPCLLLFNAAGEFVEALSSNHLPLGILAEEQFDSALHLRSWEPGDVLVVSSDGITEALNDEGVMFGIEGVVRGVRHGWPDRIGDSILEALSQHRHGVIAQDDVSLLVIQAR